MYDIPFLDIPALQSAHGVVHLPGSKSISNRVLLLAALSKGTTHIHDLLDSDDTRVMLDALQKMGCVISKKDYVLQVNGIKGQIDSSLSLDLFLGNAGTAIRPLTAALAIMGANATMRGVARMHERPIGDLVDALRQLGCAIDYTANEGFPPLHLKGCASPQLHAPIRVRGDVSSQFLTALLMALPLVAKQNITIEVQGELLSKPYIEITLNLLAQFGIVVQRDRWSRFVIPAGSEYVSPGVVHVEADASSASYFVALGAIAQRSGIRIQGVGLQSIQGDIRFVDAAKQMGAQVSGGPNWLEIKQGQWPLRAIEMDCNHIPDAAMTLAVMALFADAPSTLKNIGSWRVKETDRITAMATEARKLGAHIEEGADWLRIHPIQKGQWKSASIHTYDDHRVAMCFSLAAFNADHMRVRIEDPACVAKTFPDYFETLFSVCKSNTIPVICIDGPTASGKGTLAWALAQRLGFHYLDSGALYRITALAAVRAGLSLQTEQADTIAQLATQSKIQFNCERILLNGINVSEDIRTEEAGMNASKVSAMPAVRQALVDLQHSFQRLPGLVADGRDMGTVIFPASPFKVYLTASAEQRAQRRYKQLISKGFSATINKLRSDLEARDTRDMSRTVAPLVAAQDAMQLDNSNLSIDQSVDLVLSWWQSKHPKASSPS
ncbi:MAG: bifunctional 3-phosphoshikimate 1-carboxyvinyltransferase/cytidylate kinase [Limnohabitans sp.]|nr:bifunctional 3-phosphoshikimate 1-carboxyvinyltransferase/cytidylate kinase [Limnohabitans sp.]